MKDNIDEIVLQISSRPNDMLALGRTMMACQRTLLSYFSTSVGFLAGGVGIIMYLENVALELLPVKAVSQSVWIKTPINSANDVPGRSKMLARNNFLFLR